ncbi:MAG TPA: DUF5107 domain-containing protein, partial [Planctomycetota bacterium]|nr:DUF5107 domain-containing protein [Planctomycetota bacterium]
TYKMWAIENDYLRAIVAPELGGHLWSLRDKRIPTPQGKHLPAAVRKAQASGPGAEILFSNSAVKPYVVEPRNTYISSGIEFNFPVAHSHTSSDPVASRAYLENGRAVVEVGETERRLGTQWVIRLSLGEKDTFLTQQSFLHNPTRRPAKWHLWSNAAVDGFPDTEFIYPPGKIIVHGSKDEFAQWPMDWKAIGDREGMLGLFWLDHTEIYFGAFHPQYGHGLMHLADPKIVTGTKMWTWGGEGTKHWAELLCDDGRGMAEVQSGAFKTQEEYGLFQPGEGAEFIEFWTSARSRDDYTKAELPRPKIDLPPPKWFGNEHIPEVQRWLKVEAAMRKNAPSELPTYNPADKDWPPTGLELEAALRWAAKHNDTYRTALGTWLAAREQFDAANRVLKNSQDDQGKRLEGLMIWKAEKNAAKAVEIYNCTDFSDRSYLFEYDALLAHLGRHADREPILRKLGAYADKKWYPEDLIEHWAHQLVGLGQFQAAIDLLINRDKWQRWHERFVRTDIWRRARAGLGLPQDPVPEMLGEDSVPPVTQSPTPVGTLDGLLRQ